MSRFTWDTEVPYPAPMSPVEAAKALTEFEERIRVEREGRELPPEDGDEAKRCPYCNDSRFTFPFGPDSDLLICHGCGEQVHESELVR